MSEYADGIVLNRGIVSVTLPLADADAPGVGDYLEERAARSDRGTFERVMAKVRDAERNASDEIVKPDQGIEQNANR